MKILITDAKGYIDSLLIQYLSDDCKTIVL